MNTERTFTKMALALVVLLSALYAGAQDIKESLFLDANLAKEKAVKMRANVLAPTSFDKATKYYNTAQKDYKKQAKLESIKENLSQAVTYYKKSIENIPVSEVAFSSALSARRDAGKANASEFQAALWADAEKEMKNAGRSLEEGNLTKANEYSAKAEKLYRKAELEAIKSNFLTSARKLIAEADQKKVSKYAPVTLGKAKEHLKVAEQELNENRYDADKARSNARKAEYEAKHALYLGAQVKSMGKSSREFIILEAEDAIVEAASPLELPLEFDGGFDFPVDKIASQIEYELRKSSQLQAKLEASRREVANLQNQVKELNNFNQIQAKQYAKNTKQIQAELDKQMADSKRRQAELNEQLAYQKMVNDKFAKVERMFNSEEAEVFRQGDKIILRLVGLSFDVGSANINSEYFSMLTKVQDAIKVFDKSAFEIEGHTDSQGKDDLNLDLSQKRADAVKQYLVANMGVTASKVKAVGYGEARPVANNETASGRKKNRRIDVVIIPTFKPTK